MKNIPCTILPWWIGLQNIIYSRVCITLFQIQIGDDKKVLRIKFCSISQIPIMVTHWCKQDMKYFNELLMTILNKVLNYSTHFIIVFRCHGS